MADAWVPQPHYTGGEPVLFWDGKELVEVRMNTNLLIDAASAARSLDARFFFKRIGHDAATQTYTWGAYDRREFELVRNANPDPLKTFKTNDTAPLIMWAAAKGFG